MRRLARACETLQDKNRRILDIALGCGFSSHEHFTKTFKSAFGITPEEYRENPVHLNQVMKPELLLNYTMVDEGVSISNLIYWAGNKARGENIHGVGYRRRGNRGGAYWVAGIDIPQVWETVAMAAAIKINGLTKEYGKTTAVNNLT